MIVTKIQKSNGDICLFLFVPLENKAGHYTAKFVELLFVMHHLLSGQAGDGVIFAQEDGLFRANFFAQPAVNAADHIDLKRLREFFHLAPSVSFRDFSWSNRNSPRRTNELAKLTGNASLAPMLIRYKSWRTAIMRGQFLVPFFLRVLHRDFLFARKDI